MQKCFEISIEVNKATRNTDKCTHSFSGFKNSSKQRQNEQHYCFALIYNFQIAHPKSQILHLRVQFIAHAGKSHGKASLVMKLVYWKWLWMFFLQVRFPIFDHLKQSSCSLWTVSLYGPNESRYTILKTDVSAAEINYFCKNSDRPLLLIWIF